MNYPLNKDKDKDKNENNVKEYIIKRLKNLNNVYHEDNIGNQNEIDKGILKSKNNLILEDNIKKEPNNNDIKVKTNRSDKLKKKMNLIV